MSFHYKSRLIFFVMILFTITISFSVQAATDSEPPVVLELSVSPAVIAFNEPQPEVSFLKNSIEF
jgi:hypothetical protein